MREHEIITGITQDITDKINLENKLQSTSNILENISHELKSPLLNVIEVCNFLQEGKLNIEQDKYISIINETITFLITVINNILEVSKINADKILLYEESYNIKELIYKIIENFSLSANNKNLKLEYNFSENIPEFIYGDKNKIHQILNNLLSNAIRYTFKGNIQLNINLKEQDIYFYIIDSGIGISLDNQKEIFKPFTQFTKNAIGTGLGLSICKTLVETMNGKIGFKSDLNIGSTFWFCVKIK